MIQHRRPWLGTTLRIASAGMSAYLVGEFLNAYVLARRKLRMSGRWLALRLVASTLVWQGLGLAGLESGRAWVGQAVDTAAFVLLAFGGVFGADDLLRMGLGAWVLKVAWEVAALPLSLPFIAWLKREEGEDHFDRDTDFNPFRLKG